MRAAMIISHKHKFIFLKPYKVAGSSLEYAMSSVLGPSDVVTYLSKEEEKQRWRSLSIKEQNNKTKLVDLLRKPQKKHIKQLQKLRWPKIFHPHAKAEEVKEFLTDPVWRGYQKISVVRNPWHYLLSFYYWNPGGEARKPFSEWIFDNRHLIGANNYQYFIKGNCVIDYFVRFESITADVNRLPLPSSDIKTIKKLLEVTRFKGEFRKADKSEELAILENAPFIDPIINALCSYEINRFGYTNPVND